MASMTNRWKLGLFVMAAFVVAIGLLTWFGSVGLIQESVRVNYFFDEDVSGLQTGATVQFRGVTMGRVADIRAAPDRKHVQVVADLYVDVLRDLGLSATPGTENSIFVRDELRGKLNVSILTGVAFVQTDFVDPVRFPPPIYPFPVPENTVHTVTSTRRRVEDALLAFAATGPQLTEEAIRIADKLDEALGEADLAELMSRLTELLATIEDRVARLDELPVLVQGEATLEEAERTFAEVRELARELRSDDGPVNRVERSVAKLTEAIAAAVDEADLPATSASVRGMSDELGLASAEVSRLSEEVRRDLRSLWSTLDSVRRLAELLERDPGALLHGKGHSEGPPGIRER